MSMKPILFSTEMVRGLLSDTKTATRRVVKGYALDHLKLDTDGSIIGVYNQDEGRVFPVMDCAPYRPGDILYVRETWQHGFGGTYLYKADAGYDLFMTADGELVSDIPWRPSIHMPREAARIFLRVTDVRVERLQEIDGRGILAEGVDNGRSNPAMGKRWENMQRMAFQGIWDSTIKPADRALYGWDANPWVWVIEFERCEKPGGAR